jgi:hypothetical protein
MQEPQPPVWKRRTSPNTIPDTADNAGVPLYTSKGPRNAPNLPATAKHMLLDRWREWQLEDD